MEMATAHGWMSERFAREPKLSRLSYYLDDQPDGQDAETDADAMLTSFAMMHGLEVNQDQP